MSCLAWDDVQTIRLKKISHRQRIAWHVNQISLAAIAVLTGFVVISFGSLFVGRGRDLSPLYILPGAIVAPVIIH